MSDISNEPTMEDILSSIKKIIADDSVKLSPPRPRRAVAREPMHDNSGNQDNFVPESASPAEEEDILELTQTTPDQEAEAGPPPLALVSSNAEVASRSALEALSALVVRPEVTGTDTLEGMVREMLRPMLKEWLDANLPQVVEGLVSKEIARISGKSLI